MSASIRVRSAALLLCAASLALSLALPAAGQSSTGGSGGWSGSTGPSDSSMAQLARYSDAQCTVALQSSELVPKGHCVDDDNGAYMRVQCSEWSWTLKDFNSVDSFCSATAVATATGTDQTSCAPVQTAGGAITAYARVNCAGEEIPAIAASSSTGTSVAARRISCECCTGVGCIQKNVGTFPFDKSCAEARSFDAAALCRTHFGDSVCPKSTSSGKVEGMCQFPNGAFDVDTESMVAARTYTDAACQNEVGSVSIKFKDMCSVDDGFGHLYKCAAYAWTYELSSSCNIFASGTVLATATGATHKSCVPKPTSNGGTSGYMRIHCGGGFPVDPDTHGATGDASSSTGVAGADRRISCDCCRGTGCSKKNVGTFPFDKSCSEARSTEADGLCRAHFGDSVCPSSAVNGKVEGVCQFSNGATDVDSEPFALGRLYSDAACKVLVDSQAILKDTCRSEQDQTAAAKLTCAAYSWTYSVFPDGLTCMSGYNSDIIGGAAGTEKSSCSVYKQNGQILGYMRVDCGGLYNSPAPAAASVSVILMAALAAAAALFARA